MDAASNEPVVTAAPAKRRWNWWKVAFFVALLAFEVTRELLVLSDDPKVMPNTNASVFAYDGYVTAKGSWARIDGKGAMVPGTVTIECRRETGKCLEASTMIYKDSVFSPELDTFEAVFTPDAVTYENDVPDCAKYSVRVDLKLRKTFAVREKKGKASNPNCAALEDRIEMQLADGYETYKSSQNDALKKHFVPVVQLIAAIFDLVM